MGDKSKNGLNGFRGTDRSLGEVGDPNAKHIPYNAKQDLNKM